MIRTITIRIHIGDIIRVIMIITVDTDITAITITTTDRFTITTIADTVLLFVAEGIFSEVCNEEVYWLPCVPDIRDGYLAAACRPTVETDAYHVSDAAVVRKIPLITAELTEPKEDEVSVIKLIAQEETVTIITKRQEPVEIIIPADIREIIPIFENH